MARTIQAAWVRFLEEQGIEIDHTDRDAETEPTRGVEIPFDHADIRVIVDTLRNVSTTLRQWHLDFRLDFPPLSLVG